MQSFQYSCPQWNQLPVQTDVPTAMESSDGFKATQQFCPYQGNDSGVSRKEVLMDSEDYGMIPEVFRRPVPCQRQYSLGLVMDVITEHKISDSHESECFAKKSSFPRSEPINISKPSCRSNDLNSTGFNDSGFRVGSPRDYCLVSEPVPPSSDWRTSSSHGASPGPSTGGASSPYALPFSNYLEPDSPPRKPFATEEQNVFFRTDEKTFEAPMFQPTCQGIQESQGTPTSPHYIPTQPDWNFDPEATPVMSYCGGVDPAAETAGNLLDDSVNALERQRITSTSSCPDFGFTDDVYEAQVCNNAPASSPCALSHVTSTSSMQSYTSREMSGGFLYELEEISSIPEVDGDAVTQVDRINRRRIRNNQACRESRRRRKMRKEENEKKAAGLEDENKKLKKRIEELESQCAEARKFVLRRMSET